MEKEQNRNRKNRTPVSRRKRIRWELVLIDTLVYLANAIFILVIYPSSIYRLSPLQMAAYGFIAW